MVVGIRQTSRETRTATLGTAPEPAWRDAEDRERLQCNDRQQEDQRQARDQDVERDLVGSLLAFRALDEGDHAIQEGLAGVGGDPDLDLVGQHLGAAGHGAAVAAGLANHRRAFTGDHRFVHGRDAVDDLAVAGDQIAGFTEHDIAGAQRGAGTCSTLPPIHEPFRQRIGLGLAQSCRPAPFRVLPPSLRRNWRTEP